MPQENLVIFGNSSFSQYIYSLIENDKAFKIIAFTVDSQFNKTEYNHQILPTYNFSDIKLICPPDNHKLVIAIGYQKINNLRNDKLSTAISMGYQIGSFVSSSAIIPKELLIKNNLIICERVIIQPYVTLGMNVIIRSGVIIGHHTDIQDNCFIASGVITGGNVIIEKNCFVGLGAIIRDGVKLGARSFIGAGSVVIKDTEPDCVYVGNPAKKLDKNSFEITTR
jgi:sugar O-acyltransferase (sialic acid O-acetyltransferase NeuD family)